MPLSLGTRLGPYEIVAPLGAGGMGEVYRARDAKLGRDVAIKVLPQAFAAEPERMARFEREAKLLASLNHPSIASIFGFEDSGGISALAMELVSGPTLAERLQKAALPPEEALPMARQIAEGLEYAHERGVVHRDLKPANIKLTSDDAVKILDFGLAKAIEGDPASTDISTSPTISRMATQAGIILGTAAYMSPEQAKGKPVDRRTDIWAFGCVLFEMLTGKAAFTGESVTDILAAVVRGEPDWTQFPANTPSRIRELLRRCLEKDPKKRLQAIGEARIELEDEIAIPSGNLGTVDSAESLELGCETLRWRRRATALGVLAAAGLLSAAWLGFSYIQHVPKSLHTTRTLITAPPNSAFKLVSVANESAGFAISPDGQRLAYAASTKEGRDVLWLRTLDSLDAQPLVGTTGAAFPFWSPDGRFIAFFADGKLKKIEAGGGPAATICDAPFGRGGTWSRDGVIVFAPGGNGGLQRVNADGGNPTPVTTLDSSKNEVSHRLPFFLPDGRHFLFLAGDPFTSKDNPTNTIKVGSLDSPETESLLHVRDDGLYASGYVLYLRQNELMAQPFDVKTLSFTGDAVPLGDRVLEDKRSIRAQLSASENGMLVYAPTFSAGPGASLVWVDRTGKEVWRIACGGDCRRPAISLDGESIAYDLDTPAFEVWRYDRKRSVNARVTLSSAPVHANSNPIWSPDGRWLAYTCFLDGKSGVCRKPSDGSAEEELLLRSEEMVLGPTDWSPDGKIIAVQRVSQGRSSSLWSLPLDGERTITPFLVQSQFNQVQGRFSPDGKWLAYCSNETGEYKVYVVPYPGPGGKWQISPGAGCVPRWRRDGKEIYYVSPDKKLMAVPIKSSGTVLEIGPAKPLFGTSPYNAYGNYLGNYDVAPDGENFVLITAGEQENGVLTLVQNWDAELRKK